MLVAYALTPRELATSVRADGITDGPFVDTKEIVAGFYVIEAPDLDAALRWGTELARATRLPIEVRPFQGGE